jgi:hypothetical protein
MLVTAAEEAMKAKDLDTMQDLSSKATGQQAVDIERMITQLKPRR